MSSRPKYDNNYLSLQNGCQVVEQTSERERGPASSILSSNPKSVWVTSDKLPQQCVISMKKIIKKPVFYNTFGIYCWHQYDSNPALIEIWGKSVPQLDKWHLISKIRLNLSDTWQYFKVEDINADKIKQLKIKITENFGDLKTYVNKISLHYVPKESTFAELANTNTKINYQQHDQQLPQRNNININGNTNTLTKQTRRQKIHSEYHKPDVLNPYINNTNSNSHKNSNYNSHNSHNSNPNYNTNNSSTNFNLQLQNQLKKANQNISRLQKQQEEMKKIMHKQQKIIIEMQQNMSVVVGSLEKLRKVRELELRNSQHKSAYQNRDPEGDKDWDRRQQNSNTNKKYEIIKQSKQMRSEGRGSAEYQLQNEGTQYKQKPNFNKNKYKNPNRESSNKYSDQIEQLSKMLNNYEKKSYAGMAATNTSKQKENNSNKEKQQQKRKIKNILDKQLVKQSKFNKKQKDKVKQTEMSSEYKHLTDVIRTNSEQDLSQYDDYQQNYRTSQNQLNKVNRNKLQLPPSSANAQARQKNSTNTSKSNSKNKGQKAKMLQRLVKLLQLKQKKKLELKRSGAKSRQNKQSVYQNQLEQNHNEYEYEDEEQKYYSDSG